MTLRNYQWNRILRQINRADDCMISQITQALIRRFGVLHPNHELIVVSLPKEDPHDRKQILDSLKIYL